MVTKNRASKQYSLNVRRTSFPMMKTTFNLTAKSVVGFLFFFQKKGGNHAVAFPILFFYLCNCQGNGSCTTLADILDESVLFHPSSEIRTISRIRDKQRSSSPCMAICPSWAFPLLDVILSPRPPRRLLLLLHRTLGRPPGRGGKEASYRSITVGPSPPAVTAGSHPDEKNRARRGSVF